MGKMKAAMTAVEKAVSLVAWLVVLKVQRKADGTAPLKVSLTAALMDTEKADNWVVAMVVSLVP